jgi:hypothetical protein
MTLDRDRPRKNPRPPMSRGALIAWISGAVAVLVFVIVVLVVSGQSFF